MPVGIMLAAKEELSQIHARTCFKAITVKELARLERKRAQEGMMILSEKYLVRLKSALRTMARLPEIGF